MSEFKRFVEVWRSRNLIDYVLGDLDRRVKRDKPTKVSVFFAALSAYLPEPINLFLKGESGIGKTYNVVETLRYFPREDVWFLGGLSPKALIHEHGVLLNKHGEPLDLSEKPVKPKKKVYKSEEEYREALREYREELKAYAEEIRESYTLINLKNKILVFLEAPEFETFRMLYPILSHDTERIEYRFTDKSAKGSLRTVRVVIEGFPAAIFLTTDRRYLEELSTRSFTVTPEASKEKIGEANRLTNLKASFPWEFSEETEETRSIKALIESLKRQLLDGKTDVVIPFLNLYELFPREIVRDMRDFQHFCQFLKALTVLHFYQRALMRVGDKRFIISSVEDVKKALEIYSELFETTRTGTEQRILSFYHDLVKTKDSWLLSDLVKAYNEKAEKKASSETVRRWLERLSEIGYVNIEKSDLDKRLNTYEPLVKEEKSTIRQKLEMWTISSSELEKGFKEWLEKIHNTGGLELKIKFFAFKDFETELSTTKAQNRELQRWGEVEISIEELTKMVLGEVSSEIFSFNSKGGVLWISPEPKSEPVQEKKLETVHIVENRGIVDNSGLPKGLIQCEYCARQGVQLFFATKHDLEVHVKAFHGGFPDKPKPEYVR
jgi:DNA-binding PadR family transcriptional regulator